MFLTRSGLPLVSSGGTCADSSSSPLTRSGGWKLVRDATEASRDRQLQEDDVGHAYVVTPATVATARQSSGGPHAMSSKNRDSPRLPALVIASAASWLGDDGSLP